MSDFCNLKICLKGLCKRNLKWPLIDRVACLINNGGTLNSFIWSSTYKLDHPVFILKTVNIRLGTLWKSGNGEIIRIKQFLSKKNNMLSSTLLIIIRIQLLFKLEQINNIMLIPPEAQLGGGGRARALP